MKGRPTVAEVDRSALRANLAAITAHVGPKSRILAMVKADGYGHGGPEVARVLEKEGADAFGVATVAEGVALRENGITHAEVFVFAGFVEREVEDIFSYRLTPVISDVEMARLLQERLRASPRRLEVHVKVDSGLARLGPVLEDVPDVVAALHKFDRLEVVGVCSHLVSAHDVRSPAVEQQLRVFQRQTELFAIHGIRPGRLHLANSAAVLFRPDTHHDLVRPGLILYGARPDPSAAIPIELRPVMRLRTQVMQLRRLPAGVGVSYDGRFTTVRETTIATLPIGYADGYPRSLSCKGQVLVRGRRAPVVGAVCMDLTMVDVTDVPGVERGDEVILWGAQGSEEIRVEDVAGWAGTISYELLTRVGPRIARTYVN